MATGKIGVTTENIFPVIKKFLYSDHEIFLRELVSNAIDATQKLKTLAAYGEFKGDLGDLKVSVSIDKDAGTLTVTDRGIGMDAEDIDKYINQIAFSGAEEFLAKYKDNANNIIGHFGLGFYSAFMVSKKVIINSLSYKEGAKGVEWTCDGSPEYTLTETDRKERGTSITLYIDDDSKEFLDQSRIDTLLKKYCRFLPVPVVSGKEQEYKDGKMTDTDRDKVINSTEPLWTKKPSELTDKDYINFYHELIPGAEDPMFYIHLNVDFPFTLTGILYFPKIHAQIDIQRNRIQLYCNQVYVTDQVEGVVPEFMMLMQGVIDSPDIPLNVSRSYLQSDSQVKKISAYISKKVAERLEKLFKDDRKGFEEKWDDIKVFIEYGMLTDQKFCDSAMKFFLLKDTEGSYFTLEEYRKLVESEQTDKDGKVVYLYATDATAQYSYIEAARDKGYNVLMMNGELDSHFISLLESKVEKTHIARVDSDIVDHIIDKGDRADAGLTTGQVEILTSVVRSQIPTLEKSDFIVQFEALSATDTPVTITLNEFMRRMKEMAKTQPGMSFYGEMPDNYSLIVNTKNPVVAKIIENAASALQEKVAPIRSEIATINAEISSRREELDKINKETTQSDDDKNRKETLNAEISDRESRVATLRSEEETIEKEYAGTQPQIRQIIDLGLLGCGLLSGEALDNFIKRSVELMK